ncbi:MAG: hypothetical protein B6A08_04235 [Sorangiineae bacterium NIC37A_2]|nr:MAG: hypothetical protein B6A08_04235 [Sorangiineae bacterium NIC37A_2]
MRRTSLPRFFEFATRERASQDAHRVTGIEQNVAGFGDMGISDHEPARGEAADGLVEFFEVAAGGGARGEAVDDAGAIGVGLEAANAPKARVR